MDNPWNLPSDFTFGASTAAYQIEGAVTEGGRGPSIWDTFCAEPVRIVDGSSGAEACDHYHRYAEDVALLGGLGVEAFGTAGDPFDPSLHEAVLHDTSPEVSVPTATTVLRQGFRRGDRVLRTAMVGVSEPENPAPPAVTDDAPVGEQPGAPTSD